MRARIGTLAEGPFAEPVEVALDHRLDIDARFSRAGHHAGDPAARVRNACAGAALHANAAVGGGIELREEFLEKRAAREKFTPPLLGAKAGIAAPITRAETPPGRRQRPGAEVGDARRRYPGLPCHRRKTRLALVPPKPRLLLITTLRDAARILSTIGRPRIAGSGSSRFAQAAMKPCSIISSE